MSGDDRDLYEYFQSVRREEEAHLPSMAIPSTAAPAHRRRRLPGSLILAAVCLAAMLVAALWLLPVAHLPHDGLNRGSGQLASSISSWKPPTDFLLDTPSRELLQGVPPIGEWHGGPIPPAPVESHRRSRNQVLP